jgi:hypothetical protein
MKQTIKYRIYLHGFEPHFICNIDPSITTELFVPSYQQRINLQKSFLEKRENYRNCNPQFFIDILLRSKIGSDGFIFTDKIEHANVLIESVFTFYSMINQKKWLLSFLFSYKPLLRTPNEMAEQFSKYTAIICPFGFDHPACIQIVPFMSYLQSTYLWKRILERPVQTEIPPKFCCCIVSNGDFYSRNRMFQELSKYKRVDSIGDFQRNVDVRFVDKVGSAEYFNVLSQYKFVLCFESAVEGTYITEKIINAYISRAIPIYFGASVCKQIFNPNAFLSLEKDTTAEYERLVHRIVHLDKNNKPYLEIVNQPLFRDIDALHTQYGIDAISNRINSRIKK